MKQYELMTITKISVGEEKAKEVSEKISSNIESLKGNVHETNHWGRRKFSYLIQGEMEGIYDVIKFKLERDKLDELKSKLSLMTELVRYLITALE